MSEKAPSFNPAELANKFDDNKAAHQQELVDEYHKDLIEGAGTTSFTEDDRLHLSELSRYRAWADDRKGETADAYAARTLLESDQRARALSLEWDEAIATNESIDQAEAERTTERDNRIAQDPALRQLKLAAENVLAARNKNISEATNDNDINRIDDTTDRFYELWYNYQEVYGKDTNADIIGYFADSIDERTITGADATESTEPAVATEEVAPTPADSITGEDLDMKDARLEQDIKALKSELASEAQEGQVTEDEQAQDLGGLPSIDNQGNVVSDTKLVDVNVPAIDDLPELTKLDDIQPHPDNIESAPGTELELYIPVDEVEVEQEPTEETKKSWRQRLGNIFKRNKHETSDGVDRKKTALKALGIVAIASGLVWGATAVADHVNSDRQIEVPNDNDQDKGEAQPSPDSGKHSAEADAATKQKEREALIESDAWVIPVGGGGEALMQRLGLESNDWYKDGLNLKLYEKFGDTLYFGQGDVRFKHTGKIPESMINFIIDETNMLNR